MDELFDFFTQEQRETQQREIQQQRELPERVPMPSQESEVALTLENTVSEQSTVTEKTSEESDDVILVQLDEVVTKSQEKGRKANLTYTGTVEDRSGKVMHLVAESSEALMRLIGVQLSGRKIFHALLPYESSMAYIDEYVKHNADSKAAERLENLKGFITVSQRTTPEELPPLCDFVLNHPLYKARQSTIETNLTILKEQEKIDAFDAKTLSAVQELGRVRSVEAIVPLVPMLLLKPDAVARLNNEKIDEQYDAIKDYPVAVVLAQIGIPSIWGLLNEIATGEHIDDNYHEIAYKMMTTILVTVYFLFFRKLVLRDNRRIVTVPLS